MSGDERDDRCDYDNGSVDEWTRNDARRTLDDLDKARDYFLTHARAAALMIPPEYLSKWNVFTHKNDQTAPEVIERFVEIAADGFNDLIDHEIVEESKTLAEGGDND